MREPEHSPTPSNEKKNACSYSSNPHVPSRREQVQLFLYFTTNVEHSRSLQRSSGDCCKSRSSHRLVLQTTPLAAGIQPSDRSWPSASKCLLTQDPFSSLTIHFIANGFYTYSRSSVTSHTILSSINQSIKIWSTSTSATRTQLQIEHMKMTSAQRALNFYFLHNLLLVLSHFCYFAITTQPLGLILHDKANTS
jgi:hypothetical protein